MPALAAVGVLAALAVGAALFVPRLLDTIRREQKLGECRQLRAQIDGERVQGGDPVRAAQLEQAYSRCIAEARAQGVDIDPGLPALDNCKAQASQIVAEWSHYRSTVDVDAIKRNNTRGQILRTGEDMVRCLHNAVNLAVKLTTLADIEAFTRDQIAESRARIMCFLDSLSGCSRFGENEPHVNNRATDEILRIGAPLGIVQVYGVEWTGDGGRNHLEGTTVEELLALDARSVLQSIRLKRAAMAQLTPEATAAIARSGLGAAARGARGVVRL